MNDTVTTNRYFTVEYFADQIRQAAPRWTDVRLLGLEYVKVFATGHDAAREMEHIRNILAAVELVRAEIEAAGQ